MRKDFFIMKIIKTLLFVGIFVGIFTYVSRTLVSPEENINHRPWQYIHGFYDEPKDTLDVVYVGSSVVFASWVSPVAWKEYGLRTRLYASSGQSIQVVRPITESVYKRQPNALIVININQTLPMSIEGVHCLTDYIPRSIQKIGTIMDICDTLHLGTDQSMETIFPIIQFHSRWTRLQAEDFHYGNNGLKSANVADFFLRDKMGDVPEASFHPTMERGNIPEDTREEFLRLFNYCNENDVNVLFTISPWCASEQMNADINAVKDLITENGFDVLDMYDHLDEICLEPGDDFYNQNHTNIHGALKITRYLSGYIRENYGITNSEVGGGGNLQVNGMRHTMAIKTL